MCQAISLILTGKRVIRIPGVENHGEIMVLSGIRDISYPPDFVKIELLPPDSDDLETWLDWRRWRVSWDQDQLPGWFVEKVDKGCVYDWAERNARVVRGAEVVTGNIDLLVGKCGEVIGPCTIARCAPGSSLRRGGRAIVKDGDNLGVKFGEHMVVEYGGDMSVWQGNHMSIEFGGRARIEYGGCMSVENGNEMSIKRGEDMRIMHGGCMFVECGERMNVKRGSRMDVKYGGQMIVHHSENMTVVNPEEARILDRGTD